MKMLKMMKGPHFSRERNETDRVLQHVRDGTKVRTYAFRYELTHTYNQWSVTARPTWLIVAAARRT